MIGLIGVSNRGAIVKVINLPVVVIIIITGIPWGSSS